MRLSVVFELLLVFLFLAFAAARVIDTKDTTKNVAKGKKTAAAATSTTLRQGPPNRYCACTSRMCNCCRDFSLPVVPIKGPGCASIMYLQKDTMSVTMSFGDRVLSNTTIAGKTPKPICMNLPGGISQFCGRIYGISRKGDQFRACLGLELRALDDIEAALRVSCFKFGPKGVRLESAPPVPADSGGGTKDPEDDEDDDYDLDDEDDDLIGFDDDEDASSEDNEVDSDSADYTGFSVLGEDILGTLFSDDSGSSGTKKKKVNKKTAKPQVAIPKTSTTTRRPILPNRRRSTVRPEKVTRRPLIRVTKRPRPSSTKPETEVKPSAPVPSVASPQFEVQSTSITVVPTNVHKNIVTKEPPTTMSLTTMQTVTSGQSQEQEKMPSEEITEATIIHTDSPVTFTIPPLRIETVKNEIKIPQIDLAKVEAVAAIAQQDVTSGVISSSSLTSEETHKPSEKIVTLKIENMTPSELSENTTPYISAMTEKINSVKFVPTTVVTSSPSAEVGTGGMLLDGMVNSEIQENSNYYIIKNKNKITSQIQYTSTESVVEKEKEKEKESEESEENEDESEEEDDDEDDESEEKEQENVATNKVQQNLVSKKNNATISLKKKPSKAESSKPENDEEEQEDEEEEEEEDDDDILGGVLSDDEDNEEVEEESEESDHKPSQSLKPSNKDKVNNDEEEDEGDDNEGEILNQTEVNKTKVKPTKVSIKQKPSSNDSENEEEEEEEEEEDDDDILSVLGDDDEEESDDEDDEDNDESEGQKKKKKVTSTPPSTTVRVRKPITQVVTQTVTARKPMTTTEKVFTVKEPQTQEELSGTVTEKVIMYKEPVAKPTENIIIYNEPVNKATEKIFIYKDPENKITQKIPETVIFYQEPIASATEKLVIYREPEKIITEQPATIVYNKNDNKSSEENKEEESNEEEKDEDSTSEEESDEENDEGQHTLVASIIGKKPGFSNKYGEEHDLPESDGLDIEDAEDEGNDFEEDRKLKQNNKKPITKKPAPSVSPTVNSNNQKILTLSDLIGQRKKYYETSKNDKPISTSRTHRRMNLDRFLQV